MDALLIAAAEALSRGNPLHALKHIALRDDAQALALRGTAMAQLGEYKQAKQLLLRAARRFDSLLAHPSQAVARARCSVALAEVALAARELTLDDSGLVRAIAVLKRHKDLANVRHAQLLRARHALSLGNVAVAEQRLKEIETRAAAPALRAAIALGHAEIALRRIQPERAHKALAVACEAAQRAQIPALLAEVAAAESALTRPMARLAGPDGARLLSMAEVSSLLRGPGLIADACRRVVRQGTTCVNFKTRPVLFALARRLAEAAAGDVARDELIRVAFGMQRANDSLRARLRVSMARLRTMLKELVEIKATPGGFTLVARRPPVWVLVPPLDDESSGLLALLWGGEAWSTSALALALGASQRSVQRALGMLEEAGKVKSAGHGRSRRWLAPPLTMFATHLLLPVASHAK